MHEAMNTRKSSSGIVFSVFAEKKSNTSAALRLGIKTSHVRADFLKKSLCGKRQDASVLKVISAMGDLAHQLGYGLRGLTGGDG